MESSTNSSGAGVQEGDILAGKFRVERVLGVGGMGVVVAAMHIQLDERVALKFLLPAALDNADAVARFAREARAAVKIKNEHVARVTDVGTLPNGAPYMVMEYLEGEDLAVRLKKEGPLPVDHAVELVLQAAFAVADAHALGIVHRDLKPANLFCVRRSDGQLSIKVIDFGISKMTDPFAASMTRTSVLMGSPMYMSPEQMRSSKDVDGQTDIWALGAILYELITGHPAFLGETLTELAIKIANDPPLPIASLRHDVPGELEAVIRTCLEKDRARRFRNMSELSEALVRFAPPRARASVDRIHGVVRGMGMGMGTGGLARPVSIGTVPTQAIEQTLHPVGRTTSGLQPARGHKVAIGAGIAGAASVALVVGLLLWRHGAAGTDGTDPRVVAAGAPMSSSAGAPVAPVPLADPPLVAKSADSAPAPATASAFASSAPTPTASATAPKPTVAETPRPAAQAAQPAGPVPKPHAQARTVKPAAGCDPPYTLDAKGNHVFKPECL